MEEPFKPGSGPSEETLKHLAGMLPSMAGGMAKGRIGGRGRVPIVKRARKVCTVCDAPHDFAMLAANANFTISVEPCPDCQRKLSEKWICFTSATRYGFVRPKPDADVGEQIRGMCGKIVNVSVDQFAHLVEMFKFEPKEKATPDVSETPIGGESPANN